MGWCSHLCFILSCPTRPIFKHERRGYGNRPFRHHHHRHSFLISPPNVITLSHFAFNLKHRGYTTKSFVRPRMGASTGFLVHLSVSSVNVMIDAIPHTPTGSPSSKYEHRRASALLRNIRNIRICMGKKPIVSVPTEMKGFQ